MPTHLYTCALVWRIRCIDIQQDQEKSPFTHSVRIWGQFPVFFCVCVYLHAPVLCFLALNSGGLSKQVAESNSQQMPFHRVKISPQAVCVRQNRSLNDSHSDK